MTTAIEILNYATKEIGYTEGRNDANKYGTWYGLPDTAWCAEFVSYIFNEANALALLPGGKFAGCTTGMKAWKAAGKFDSAPSIGALVFYNFDGTGPNISTHVGIVENFDSGTITTIEGNAPDETAGPDGVYRHRRARNKTVLGYGHPAYSQPVTVATTSGWAEATPNIDTLAQAVIRGDYGNGDARKAALGSLYDQVQARVNAILANHPSTTTPDIDALARAVIRGDYGNGATRKTKLGALYNQVQARVNQILQGK